MIPIVDEMDARRDNNITVWTVTESPDTLANTSVDDSTPFDSSILGEILAALDYYYIPVLIAVGLIGNEFFISFGRLSLSAFAQSIHEFSKTISYKSQSQTPP